MKAITLGSAVLLAASCTFSGASVGDPAGDGDGDGDADSGVGGTSDGNGGEATIDAAHVPPEGDFAGTADLLVGDIVIDTTNLTIDGAGPPNGIVFEPIAHEDVGPELAVLHVRGLSVNPGTVVSVRGTRPLVVIASEAITIDGTLEASAIRESPGAGGFAPAAGPSPGRPGIRGANRQDSGGGGGANSTDGGRGGAGGSDRDCDGAPTLSAPAALAVSSGADILRGGSGGAPGGRGSNNCNLGIPGAGGGAIQLTSSASIRVEGTILVGGGGGGGGDFCGNLDSGGGAGGGAGGTIYLEAPTIENLGMLAANGGAGGGGASGPGGDGDAGQNGRASTEQAEGGDSGGTFGEKGGWGGSVTTDEPLVGDSNDCEGNGGGGGGAAGWIVADGAFSGDGDASPAPSTL